MLICHRLEQGDLLLMVWMEFTFVIIQERVSFSEKLLANHNQVEAHEYGELNPHELKFRVVLALVDKVFDLLEAIYVVASIFP